MASEDKTKVGWIILVDILVAHRVFIYRIKEGIYTSIIVKDIEVGELLIDRDLDYKSVNN